MKKYIKPEITYTLLMEELSICAGSPQVDHSASHGSNDEHGTTDFINEGQPGAKDPTGTYPVQDDWEGDHDSFSKGQSIWDEW